LENLRFGRRRLRTSWLIVGIPDRLRGGWDRLLDRLEAGS